MAANPLLPLLLLLLTPTSADFQLFAGNWTHSTNLFANYHFIPGYNALGEWDILTGGNWTATNHSDANLVGDAEVYLCPCPEPPCNGSGFLRRYFISSKGETSSGEREDYKSL